MDCAPQSRWYCVWGMAWGRGTLRQWHWLVWREMRVAIWVVYSWVQCMKLFVRKFFWWNCVCELVHATLCNIVYNNLPVTLHASVQILTYFFGLLCCTLEAVEEVKELLPSSAVLDLRKPWLRPIARWPAKYNRVYCNITRGYIYTCHFSFCVTHFNSPVWGR